jgi:hypothetical protein
MTIGQKLKDLGKGIGGFLQSVGQGVGKAIQGIMTGLGMGIRSLGQAIAFPTPLGPAGVAVAAFFIALAGAMWLAEPAFTALAPVMIKIAEVIGNVLVEALRQAGPIITAIFNGIAKVVSSVGTSIATVITSIATAIGNFSTMDAGNLAAVGLAIAGLGAELAVFGSGSFIAGVGKFFGGSVFDDLKDISKYSNPLLATASAVSQLALAFKKLGSVNLDALADIPWMKMTAFAAAGGQIVVGASAKAMSPGNKSVANPSDKWIQNKMVQMNGNLERVVGRTQATMVNTANTANQLKVLNTNTSALINLTTKIEALTRATYEGSTVVKVDGKIIAKASNKYTENLQASNPTNKTGVIGAVTGR